MLDSQWENNASRSSIGAAARAGAGLALLSANTPHLVFNEVQSRADVRVCTLPESA